MQAHRIIWCKDLKSDDSHNSTMSALPWPSMITVSPFILSISLSQLLRFFAAANEILEPCSSPNSYSQARSDGGNRELRDVAVLGTVRTRRRRKSAE